MRRIDVIGIGVGAALAGGGIYLLLRLGGIDSSQAGLWSQVIFLGGLLGWVASYVFRATTGNMTFHQQVKEYEDAVLQKRLEELTPEEFAKLQAELEAEVAADMAAEGATDTE
ncbi:MAG: DUF3007 family protein [Cyanobacteria bacterium P01_A01_bin.135]